MLFKIYKPSPFLQPYIRDYCFMETEKEEGAITERVIPAGGIQLMFHYRNPFVVYQHEKPGSTQPRTFISGLGSSYSDVSTSGAAGVVFVAFHPAGACHFFPFPLARIENKSIDLSEIFGTETKIVEEALCEQANLSGKLEVIENFLTKKFSGICMNDNRLIRHGVKLIFESKGQITAGDLAKNLATTPKSLERKFAAYIGKTPKQFIKLIRFHETIQDFNRGHNISLTEYAVRNGYYDQSHFIRDFREYAGLTPKEFVSRYTGCGNDGYN